MNSGPFNKNLKGFTLIELLVVIAIIVTLAVLVSVAIDPVRRFQESRNARRWSDVNSINTAIHTFILDNSGAMPSGMVADGSEYQLGTCSNDGAALCPGAADACLDLGSELDNYLKSMPIDPLNGTASTTGYSVSLDSNMITTVKACSAERSTTIQISQ